jgi:hypothetical protein
MESLFSYDDWRTDRALDDSAYSPNGSSADTNASDEKVDPTPEELLIEARFKRGEITQEEAETLLGMLAADHDL